MIMAFVGTTVAFSRTSSNSRTLANCPGRRTRSGLGISARTEKVPVLGSTCGSAKSTEPRSGYSVLSARRTVTYGFHLRVVSRWPKLTLRALLRR